MPPWIRIALTVIALLVVAPATADAQALAAPSFDLERIEFNPSGIGSLLVGSGELMPAGSFRSAVLAHYAHEPLLLGTSELFQGRVVRERLSLHLMRQYSLGQRVEFALLLPIILFQDGDDLTSLGLPRLAGGGLGSPTISARVALLRGLDGAPLDVAVQVATQLPFGNANAFGRNPGLTFAPKLLVSRRLDHFIGSAEFGGLLRPPVRVGDISIHHELHGAAALATAGHALRGEVGVRGAWYFRRIPKSAEVFGGVRYAINDRVELTSTLVGGLLSSPGIPAFRVMFGASFLEGTKVTHLPEVPPLFPARPKAPIVVAVAEPVCVAGEPHEPADCPGLDLDGDGVANADDACPAVPGVAERAGCPIPDRDEDGVADEDDRCPDEAGPPERKGCPIPDRDKDGVEDEDDRCPDEPGPPARQGCPFRDRDNDGIEDKIDLCPDEEGPAATGGCPVKDTDGDGIPDHLDSCPKAKGTMPNHGCPAKKRQRVVVTQNKLVILDKVFFATGKATILRRSNAVLSQVAQVLNEHPQIRLVVIEGHTDNVGGDELNMRLSQSRAESVRNFLMRAGVDGARLEAKGYGPSRPSFPNLLPAGREANRRVEFTIPQPEAPPAE